MQRSLLLVVAAAIVLAVAGYGWFLRSNPDEPETVARMPPTEDKAASGAGATPVEKAAPATATPLPALAGQTFIAGCRQGECGWTRVLRFERVEMVPAGELRRLITHRGFSRDDEGTPSSRRRAEVDWEPGARTSYVFCSVRRPAFAFEDELDAFPGGDGDLIVHFLDMFNLAGYNTPSAATYMRACHGSDGLPGADELRTLGYRPGTRNEQVENATLEDITRF